jgi:hypothetical protein
MFEQLERRCTAMLRRGRFPARAAAPRGRAGGAPGPPRGRRFG